MSRRRPGQRLAAVIGLGALTVTAWLGLAAASPGARAARAAPGLFAHAAIVSTDPADGSVLAKEPAQVTATFDQPVAITPGSLEVYTPDGGRADTGNATLPRPGEVAATLRPGLGDGTYTAAWHVVSADTHPVSGAFTFSIGAPSATHVAAFSVSPNALVSGLFAAARWLEYACFAVLCGTVAFLIACWPAGARRAGVIRLVTASWAGLLLATLCGLLLQGPYAASDPIGQLLSPQLVRSTLDSKLGAMSQAREVLAFLAGGTASLVLSRLPAAGRRARIAAGAAWAAVTTAVAASWAVYDHASTGVQGPWGGVPADIIHLDAMAIWIGGLVVLAGFGLRHPADAGVVIAVRRFSAIALGCVTAIVASGAYQTWRLAGVWQALFDTGYGRLILAKTTGLLFLIGLGYLARHYIQRGLRPAAVTAAGEPGAPPGPGWEPAMRRLRRSVAVELLVAAVVLALTAVLVNTATGRESYAPAVSASRPFATGGPNGTGLAHVFVSPARLGPNTIDVYFTTASGKAYVPAQVTAALYFPARNLGPVPVKLTRIASGQYRAAGTSFAFTGSWSLAVTVRSDAFDETTLSFGMVVH